MNTDSMDFISLPDSMYLIIPRTLPTITNENAEIHLEFGGIMHSGEGKQLRRSILTFNSNGLLKSSKHDTFQISIA